MKIKFTVALIAATILLPQAIIAQNATRGVVEAVIGSDLNSVLPDDVVYMYPEFQKGTILFSDRSSAEGTVNLYLIGSQVHFIAPGGDTLVMKDQDKARLLSVGKDTYIRHDRSWVRIISVQEELALGIRSTVNFEQAQKIGAYGMTDATSSISSVDRISDIQNQPTASGAFGNAYGSTSSAYLKSLRNIPYTLTHDVLLYDGEKLYTPSRRNFTKFFPGKKDLIKKYVKDNKLDLNKAQDALKLFNFLSL
jgi:hypothetical protein